MKALLTDFDGTLATDKKEVTKECIDKICELIDGGFYFALVTGRMTTSMYRVLEKLPFKPLIAAYNGVEIVNGATGERLKYTPVLPNQSLEIIRFAKEHNINCQLYSDKVLVDKLSDHNAKYCAISMVEREVVGDLEEYVKKTGSSTPKVMFLDEEHVLDEFTPLIERTFSDRFYCVRTGEDMYEFMPYGTDKGKAVLDLCDIWGIDTADCVAVGDELNDVEMIKTAGVGVAVANAKDKLKQVSDYVCVKDNNGGGVAEVIEKFFIK